MEGTTFQVEAGEGFIIFPHQIAHYQADVEAPWAYTWVAFSGEGLDELLQPGGISRRFPIIRHRDRSLPLQLLNAMIGFAKENTAAAPLQVAGLVLLLLGEFCQTAGAAPPERTVSRPGSRHIERAVYYIKTYYYQPISIHSVADYVGIDGSYLSRLFRRYFRQTPAQFLCSYRLEVAKQLLLTTQAAVAVGFADPLYFSRRFRQSTGMTPSAYRQHYRTAPPPNK